MKEEIEKLDEEHFVQLKPKIGSPFEAFIAGYQKAMEAQKKLNHHLPIPFGTWVLVDGNEKEKYQVIDYDVLNDRYNLDLDGAWIWFDANRISVDKDFAQKQPAMSLEELYLFAEFIKDYLDKNIPSEIIFERYNVKVDNSNFKQAIDKYLETCK